MMPVDRRRTPLFTKQEALTRLCRMLGMSELRLHRGSSVPVEVFLATCHRFGLDPHGSMPELGERIARRGGQAWDTTCDSRTSPSGGGSTVTRVGLNRMVTAVETMLGTRPPEPSGPEPTFGQPYRRAVGGIDAAPEGPLFRDWSALDAATRAHADTQNALEAHVRQRGHPTFSPGPGEPGYDLAWRTASGLVVAEVKSTTGANQRQQIRLGLGQVLDYRHELRRLLGERPVAVLAVSGLPHDDERDVCAEADVVLTCPATFGPDLAAFVR